MRIREVNRSLITQAFTRYYKKTDTMVRVMVKGLYVRDKYVFIYRPGILEVIM